MTDPAWALRHPVMRDREAFRRAVVVPVWLLCPTCLSPRDGRRPPRARLGVGLSRENGALVVLDKRAKRPLPAPDHAGSPDEVFTHLPGFSVIRGKAVFACGWHTPPELLRMTHDELLQMAPDELLKLVHGGTSELLQLTPSNLLKLVRGVTESGRPLEASFAQVRRLVDR